MRAPWIGSNASGLISVAPAARVETGDPGLKRGQRDAGGNVDASERPGVRPGGDETVVQGHGTAVPCGVHRVADADVPNAVRIREQRRRDAEPRTDHCAAPNDLPLDLAVVDAAYRAVQWGGTPDVDPDGGYSRDRLH